MEDLAQLGYTVTTLTGADLTPEKLRGLDAVVIGVRAFNERTDFAANFPALLAWVEQGGTVIAQYNRPNGLRTQQLGPYPLSIKGQAPPLRVTDEERPRPTFLLPDHPALNVPNQNHRRRFRRLGARARRVFRQQLGRTNCTKRRSRWAIPASSSPTAACSSRSTARAITSTRASRFSGEASSRGDARRSLPAVRQSRFARQMKSPNVDPHDSPASDESPRVPGFHHWRGIYIFVFSSFSSWWWSSCYARFFRATSHELARLDHPARHDDRHLRRLRHVADAAHRQSQHLSQGQPQHRAG